MGTRVEWDDLDVLFEDEEPLPEGAEVILPDYDYDGGFTDEEAINDLQSIYNGKQRINSL